MQSYGIILNIWYANLCSFTSNSFIDIKRIKTVAFLKKKWQLIEELCTSLFCVKRMVK